MKKVNHATTTIQKRRIQSLSMSVEWQQRELANAILDILERVEKLERLHHVKQ